MHQVSTLFKGHKFLSTIAIEKLEVVFFDQFGLLQGIQGVVGAGMREIGQFVQRLLPLAHVPVQTFGKRVEPIGYLVLGTDAGHRILGGGHS